MQNKTVLSAKAMKMKRPVAAGLQGEGGVPARRPLCANGGGLHPHERRNSGRSLDKRLRPLQRAV